MQTTDITSFFGPWRWLSNFYPAPVMLDSVPYDTVEHAYQAAKTISPLERLGVAACHTAGRAKRQGRKVTLRRGWKHVRVPVMEDLLRQKFAPGSELAAKLVATYPRMLIEGNNWHDNYWGSCRCDVCGFKGMNVLGVLLMTIRAELRKQGVSPCLKS